MSERGDADHRVYRQGESLNAATRLPCDATQSSSRMATLLGILVLKGVPGQAAVVMYHWLVSGSRLLSAVHGKATDTDAGAVQHRHTALREHFL